MIVISLKEDCEFPHVLISWNTVNIRVRFADFSELADHIGISEAAVYYLCKHMRCEKIKTIYEDERSI